MARYTYGMSDFEHNEQIVNYKGVDMKYKEMIALKRKEAKLKGIQERNAKLIPLLFPRIKANVKAFKLAKSVDAYYHNGYKQWGVIAKEITEHPMLAKHFIMFVQSYRNSQKCLTTIEKVAKRNDHDIFGYVEKLAYHIDDMGTHLNNLSNAIIDVQILTNKKYEGKEAIFGEGRRLGLRILVQRTTEALIIAQKSYRELIDIVNNGADVMSYDANSKKTITFVQG